MFDFKEAFSRTLGWVSKSELEAFKNVKIAVAGCGGVGGEHLLTLARMGFQNFVISDLDKFDIANLNRQAFAFMSTMGEEKVEVSKRFILDVNPQANVKTFPAGIDESNVKEFLSGADIYVDGMDVFCMDTRKLLFRECERQGIPIFTAGPLGMGTSFICFDETTVSTDDYFDFDDDDKPSVETAKFLLGLAPSLVHTKYIAEHAYVDLVGQRVPSVAMGIKAASAVLVTEVVKYVLKRGPLVKAPSSIHSDAYLGKLKRVKLLFGNRGLVQRIKLAIITKYYLRGDA